MSGSFYVGAYTNAPKSPGVTRWSLSESGALRREEALPFLEQPSYLALSPDGRALYAALENDRTLERPGGGVAALVRAGEAWACISVQNTGGGYPCHLSLLPEKGKLYVANYGGGSLAVFDVLPDGTLSEHRQLIRHQGQGPNAQRQEGSHVHQALPLSGEVLLAMDLGLDRGLLYEILPEGLLGAEVGQLTFPPGSGPRHGLLLPGGGALFALCELTSELIPFVPGASGWEARERVPTLPPDWNGENTAAALRLHPDGRHLAVTNRGHDSVSLFAVTPGGGIRLVQTLPCGKNPRDCNWSGDDLICACQGEDALWVFRLDAGGGGLLDTGERASTPEPTCVLPIPEGRP